MSCSAVWIRSWLWPASVAGWLEANRDGQRGRQDARRGGPHQYPRADQRRRRGGQLGQHRRHRKTGKAHRQHTPATEAVGQATADQQQARKAHEKPIKHPLQLADAGTKIGRNVRQRHVDDRAPGFGLAPRRDRALSTDPRGSTAGRTEPQHGPTGHIGSLAPCMGGAVGSPGPTNDISGVTRGPPVRDVRGEPVLPGQGWPTSASAPFEASRAVRGS